VNSISSPRPCLLAAVCLVSSGADISPSSLNAPALSARRHVTVQRSRVPHLHSYGLVIETRPRWVYELHHRANARTIVEPSLIIAPERHSKLSRISPHDGSVLWTAGVDNPWGWLVAAGSACAYLNQHSSIQCFDIATGSEQWAVELSGRHGQIFGHLIVAGNVVITGGWRGYTDLLALSLRDGTVTWTTPTRNRRLMAPVAGPDETVLLAFPEEGRASLIEAATGSRIAELPCPTREPLPDGSPFVQWSGTRFVCADDQGSVFTLDPDGNSKPRWEEVVRHHTRIRSSAPFLADDLIAFEDENGLLSTYSLATGSQLWQAQIQHRRRDILPAVRLQGDNLAVGTAFGQLLILDEHGRLRDNQRFGKHFLAGLAATPAGTILAAVDGRVIAVAVEPAE
jgi:outer membrane protein assembly factor BamB